MNPPIARILGLVFALVLSSCGDGSHTKVTAPTRFQLAFHASLGDRLRDVSCDTPLTELGTSKAQGELLDLALFVHGLTFLRADGSVIPATLDASEWQAENVVLLDFQNKSDSCSGAEKPINTVIKGEVENSEGIVGVRFVLGIPPALNHLDPATVKAPLNAPNMFWGWQGGYKAMRFDVSPANGITRPSDPNFLGTNFFFHLGSTDCVGDPTLGEDVSCGRVNQAVITLDNFHLESSAVTIDLEALVSALNLEVDTTDSPGCMSAIQDVECESYFTQLGMDLNLGQSVPSLNQSVFRLR